MITFSESPALSGESSAFKNDIPVKTVRHFRKNYQGNNKDIWSKVKEG